MSLHSDISQEHDPKQAAARFRAYRVYLETISEYLPKETQEFILSEWYYKDPDKCPHDAWLESAEIIESGSGKRGEKRDLRIVTCFLSASHRGRIHFNYLGVNKYELCGTCMSAIGNTRHGDWLADQITLCRKGEIEHEISFSSGVIWRIRCRSISYEYRVIAESRTEG